MNPVDQEWQKLTKRGDTVERLKAAGLPCTGLRNYRPVMADGSEADIERVRDILSTTKTEPTQQKNTAPIRKKQKKKQK